MVAYNGTPNLAALIRARREQLGLTIAGAARIAGVSPTTWSSYEHGGGIRGDKIDGVLDALQWDELPGAAGARPGPEGSREDDLDAVFARVAHEFGDTRYPGADEMTVPLPIDLDGHPARSEALIAEYGELAATTFAEGSDFLLAEAGLALDELETWPAGTHIGEIETNGLAAILPGQFIARYDYEFVYVLIATAHRLRQRFALGDLSTRTVLEELVLLVVARSGAITQRIRELWPTQISAELDAVIDNPLLGAAFDEIVGDRGVEEFLYSPDWYVDPGEPYHFDRWREVQFTSE